MIKLPNGDDVHCPELGAEYGAWRLVPRWLVDGVETAIAFDGEKVVVKRQPQLRQVRKSVIISRLTDAQLSQAIGMLTVRQQERWRAPDCPVVNENDPETLAILAAVGADPAVVMAPE